MTKFVLRFVDAIDFCFSASTLEYICILVSVGIFLYQTSLNVSLYLRYPTINDLMGMNVSELRTHEFINWVTRTKAIIPPRI